MSGRSPLLRALRPRSQISPKSPQRERIQSVDVSYNEESDLSANQLNNLELENTDAQDDDSDSDEPRLVIKEEPEDNTSEDKNTSDRKYECKSCKPTLEFPNLIEYLQHLKDQHQQKSVRRGQTNKIASDAAEPNKCTMCSFVAVNPSEMESHQRLHHLKRRFFRCSKCSYMTHVRARYTKHVKYHSMPLIKCDDCDFRTPYKWNLDRHTRNHGGGGPFHCRACNFTADIRQSLTVHEMNHHDPPVGVSSKKPTGAFERKSRNGPKRYNQVGGSDFRDRSKSPSEPDTSNTLVAEKSSNEEIIENSMDVDAAEAIAGVDCIALKCEENGCQFITAWDSEMQRHLIEEHGGPQTPSKSRKPLPMLIPLSPGSKSTTTTTPPSNSSQSNVLNVPRVRVRPELAKIARDTEIAKLYGTRESPSPKKEIAVNSFEKRNAIFFDKLKERLVATSAINGITQVAVSNISDLKCWCTFEASSPEELANHKKTHHTALSVAQCVSRCPKCLKRCKSLSDLEMHVQVCQLSINNLNDNDSSQEITVNSDTGYEETSHSNEFELPFQVDWDGRYGGLNSSGSSVEGLSQPGTTSRRVFKCPHCPFWASTASRFHVHIVGHLNRKPFECSLCAYRSNWRWDITKHIKLKSARDPAHMNARVLMTDETGRRNYSKYNKYLAQMEHQGPDDPSLEESQGEYRGDEPSTKLFITTNSQDSSDFGNSRTNEKTIKVLSIDVNSTTPKKQTPNILRNQGQSLLKINPSTSTTTNAESLSASTSTKETKRTLWKCKKCHFRDSSKEMVLIHVKSHYESAQQCKTNSKNSNNELACSDCPFVAVDATTLAIHKVHHRPNLEAIFKCYLCPYYVRTKAELLEHIHLHGEELAIDHQQKEPDSSKKKSPTSEKQTLSMEEVTNSTPTSSISIQDTINEGQTAPPLLLDTRDLPDTPMVWVSSNDGVFSKMLKCRHCPHVSSRRAGIRDHETMHTENPDSNSLIACPDCSFCCGQRDVMEAHAGMHIGSQVKVHCLIDDSRTDAQQLADIKSLLGLEKTPIMGESEPDLRDPRLVYYCGMCPARFLCEKELRIHLRYHSTTLAYSCEWCSYAARQPAHLLAHQKAHSTEYQERSRCLSRTYGNSERYPPPMTACVEAKNQTGENNKNIAWIVVEVSPKSNTVNQQNSQENDERNLSEVFTCEKCPARYFKLDALEYHMTLHGSNNRFKCVDCDYSSKTAQNLLKHQVVHKRHTESNEPTTCRLQSQDEPQYGTFMRGNPNFVYPGYVRNGRVKEKRFKCHKCPSAFEKRDQYKIHLALHGSKQRYRCETCDYAVKYYANYVQHVKKHQNNAQTSRRRMEPTDLECNEGKNSLISTKSRRKSTISSGSLLNSTAGTNNEEILPVSNQDKQTTLLMQKKVGLFSTGEMAGGLFSAFKCLECPFSAPEKDAVDIHKRRHGIERLTPPCPHCNYVPRKDENVGDHIRLHFTRLYKPEGYLIVELLSLKMKRVDGNNDEKDKENELLFSECEGGQFLPATDVSSLSVGKTGKGLQEKVIVDPNTGETTHRFKV